MWAVLHKRKLSSSQITPAKPKRMIWDELSFRLCKTAHMAIPPNTFLTVILSEKV